VKNATEGAREELAKENFDLSASGQPKAEITPGGELLIDGKAVPLSAEQKALLIEYRGHIAKLAEAGIGIGLEGADLAGKAVSEAIKGIFTGQGDQVEKKIEAEAEGIRASAQKLCELLPAMKATQDKLAAALPEFKPYATMDQKDVEDCGKDGNYNIDIPGSSVHADVDVGNDYDNTAAEAEAATVEPAK
jgi:hypothetical protein